MDREKGRGGSGQETNSGCHTTPSFIALVIRSGEDDFNQAELGVQHAIQFSPCHTYSNKNQPPLPKT